LYGYSVRETAGALAKAVLCDGTSAAGPVLAVIGLPAGGGYSTLVPDVPFSGGIYVSRTVGSSELVLYVDFD
jgi:hypothetical protein